MCFMMLCMFSTGFEKIIYQLFLLGKGVVFWTEVFSSDS